MGAKTWMLVHGKRDPKTILRGSPTLDRAATTALASRLFSSEKLAPLADGDLSFTCPPDNEIVIGCFPDLVVVAAKECAIDHPSRLPRNGALQRSLSLAPDNGIIEDMGTRFPFEAPYWAGSEPVGEPGDEDAYPLPFHPLELGEAALTEFFGYQLEGFVDSSHIEPERVPLMRFQRKKAWWRIG